MTELELWSDIIGYEGLYQVSNFGRVNSLGRVVVVKQDRYDKPRAMHWKSKMLKPAISKSYPTSRHKGYVQVKLRKDGKTKNYEVHRLVAIAFVDNPNEKPVVNHIDANPSNNHHSNLEWCTIRENNAHTTRLGRRMHNGAYCTAKLNSKQVRIIKFLLLLGIHPIIIAKRFKTSRSNIYSIRKGDTWKHI
jgi:hypothetical protein